MFSTTSTNLDKDSVVEIYRERLTRRFRRPPTDREVYEYMVRKNEDALKRRGELDKEVAERGWAAKRQMRGSWQPDDRDLYVDGGGDASAERRVERYPRAQRAVQGEEHGDVVEDTHTEEDPGSDQEDAAVEENEDPEDITLRAKLHQQQPQHDPAGTNIRTARTHSQQLREVDMELHDIINPPNTTTSSQQRMPSRPEGQPIDTTWQSAWQQQDRPQYAQQYPRWRNVQEEAEAPIQDGASEDQIGHPRQQQGTDFQVPTNNYPWQAQQIEDIQAAFRPPLISRRQHHQQNQRSSISLQDADEDEEELHYRLPTRDLRPPMAKSYRTYGCTALILTAALWLLTLLLLWISTSWFGWRPVSISPYRLPPPVPTRLETVLPARTKKYANSLQLLVDAQYELTFAHNSYCHSLEAACQLIPRPAEDAFYGRAMVVWMTEDKRSCPLPVACKVEHANYNTGGGSGMERRHPAVVKWLRETADLVLEAGDAIRDGVKAGDALLTSFLAGTSTLEDAIKRLQTTISQTKGTTTGKSYSSSTSIAWLCGYHTDLRPNAALHIYLFPFCQTIPRVLEMKKLYNADAADPLWTHKWVIDVNAALNTTFQNTYDASVQAIQHIDTMKSSGQKCGKAVAALKENAGPRLSPLAVRFHGELEAACLLLQGETKLTLELTRLKSHLVQLITDMHRAQDMLLPLLVFRPPPSSNRAVTNYDKVLVLDPTSDGDAMWAALAKWRSWELVDKDTQISKAVKNAAAAMAFKNIAKQEE